MTPAPSGTAILVDLGNDLGDLAEATESLDRLLERWEVGDEVRFNFRLILEEVATNVIKYAYPDAGPHRILLAVRPEADGAVLEVSDDGREFDPLGAPPPDLGLPIEDRPVGGLGIHLVRKIAREVRYARIGGRNVLTVRIPWSSEEGTGQEAP